MNIEITVRDIRQLDDIIEKLLDLNPQQINLTDKTGLSDNLLMIEAIKGALPDAHYVPHYAFKNHTSKIKDTITENYKEFLTQVSRDGIKEVLLVSGIPKPKIDTLAGLALAQDIITQNNLNPIEFGVAYNPFLPGEELEIEKKRLEAKLAFGTVKRVYLQIGTLVHPFRNAIKYIRSLNPELEITPGIVIPSKNFLTKFRFRPWKGVLLDDKYLANVNNANQKTRELLEICNEMEVKPLLEIISIQNMETDYIEEQFGSFLK